MDGNPVNGEGGVSGSTGANLGLEAAGSVSALRRPFAFPNLRQGHRHVDTRECSLPSEDRSAVAASRLTQEAEAPRTSTVPDIGRSGTPLPPNPFEPIGTAASVRADAFVLVPIVDIIIGERLRGIVEEFISLMIDSISIHEVMQPPVVRPDPSNPGKFILVSGLQRLNAARIRGQGVMLCRVVELTDVEASLWEIDENLVRATLSPAQEALFVDRRRTLHEQLHGTSKARGALAANTAMGRAVASANLADATFTAETAKKTGRSERTIQRIVQRATQNGRTTLTRIAGTTLDRGAELDALPLLPHATRVHLIERAAAGVEVSAILARKQMREPPAEAAKLSAAAAVQEQPSNSLKAQTEPLGLSTLKSAWLSASVSAREVFLTWIKIADRA